MNTVNKGLFCVIALFCAFSTISFGQTANINADLNINVAGGKTNFKANEQVIMKVTGFDEEKATLQWQVSADEKTWQDIPRATGDIFETYPVTQNQYFRVVTRPVDGYLSMEQPSKAKAITLDENVALRPAKRN
jgi:hypothetical protein